MPATATDRLFGLTTSVAVKAPCRTVATSAITLSGLQTVDGVSLSEGDRVLVTAQSNLVDNGIYLASSSAWQRTPDFDGARDAVQGTQVPVTRNGTQTALYEVSTANPFTIGTSEIVFALRYSTSLRYDLSTDEISNSIAPSNFAYPPGHVYRYAANAVPGTTDMTVAFQRAALSSLTPYAPGETCKITGTITIRANQRWTLNGTIISIASSTLTVFSASALDDWSLVGPFQIVGDGSTSGTAKGISISDCRRWRIVKPTLRNIRGWGIYSLPGSNTTERGSHGTIDNPQIDSCYIGYQDSDGTGAEYCTILDPRITRCTVDGLLTAAGNVLVNGGHITDNTKGIHVAAGGGNNSNHGGFFGVNINHNGFNLHCEQVMNGETFDGCHFYQGTVWFDRCKGILIDGGILDAPIYNYKDGSSGINIIRGAYMPGGYGAIRNGGTNDGHEQLIIEQCFGPGAVTDVSGGIDVASGVNTNDAFRVHVYARRANGANQSLTSGVAADILFPTEVNDRRKAFDPATGIFTVPAGMGSWYRLKASCLFTGTAMSSTASVLEIKVNGTAIRICLPKINSTTRLQINVDETLYLAAGDVVKLTATITGTTPVFGDATYESHLSIEMLG